MISKERYKKIDEAIRQSNRQNRRTSPSQNQAVNPAIEGRTIAGIEYQREYEERLNLAQLELQARRIEPLLVQNELQGSTYQVANLRNMSVTLTQAERDSLLYGTSYTALHLDEVPQQELGPPPVSGTAALLAGQSSPIAGGWISPSELRTTDEQS